MSVGVMRDGATFSFCLPTAHKNKKQGLTPSSVTPSSVRILRLVDACTEPGSIAALLHREELYSSHLTDPSRLAS
jgi:hypothetical protein